ncbi:SPINK5 isoform 5 [Pan troglodytes]|uniref:SPINK5 isoform 5 n=1 Tax=Pan troglodytes TaxID=9598 RepID=A0A2J8NJ80_PANTR|nr:SPINK5 isoform 5 [Pan troglodytes]
MKIATVSVLLPLALCLIQDAASKNEDQEICHEFQAFMKNGKLLCPQDKKFFQSLDGIMFINKCATCKMILEKEAKSQKRARHLARAAKATAPTELNCDDFKKGERDGDFICPDFYEAVCGTDGKTYDNRCALCAENAKTGSQIGVKSEGECKSSNPEQFCEPVMVGEGEGRKDLVHVTLVFFQEIGSKLMARTVLCLSSGT